MEHAADSSTVDRERGTGDAAAATAAGIPRQADVAVVGAGVIGLSIGWRLAAKGLSVVVLDCGAASPASPAASGMLAAAAELEPCSSGLFRLALESQRLWPPFRSALEAASGTGIDYRDRGTLVVAIGRDEVDRLRFRLDLQRREGAAAHWLDRAGVMALEPGLRPSVSAAIHCPLDHQVEPRHVLAALRRAFAGCGGTIVEACRVLNVELAGGRVAGALTSRGFVAAPLVVVAAGAWSAAAGLLPAGVDVPVRPLKGQSLSLRVPRGVGRPEHVVWTDQIHVAPKADRLVIGATVEEAGFDASATAGGLYALLEAARRILPSIEELRVEALQVGFRPTSADDAPIIGPTGVSGLLLATGHHRNGYLLAPVTAHAIEALVVSGKLLEAAAPFGLARFAASQNQGQDREKLDAGHHQRPEARV